MVRAGPSSLVDRLRMPMYRSGGTAGPILVETTQADMAEAAGRIGALEAALKAVSGYLVNARIDLETSTKKRANETLGSALQIIADVLAEKTDAPSNG